MAGGCGVGGRGGFAVCGAKPHTTPTPTLSLRICSKPVQIKAEPLGGLVTQSLTDVRRLAERVTRQPQSVPLNEFKGPPVQSRGSALAGLGLRATA